MVPLLGGFSKDWSVSAVSAVSGQLSVVTCPSSVVSGDQRTTENGQRTTDYGQLTTEHCAIISTSFLNKSVSQQLSFRRESSKWPPN